MTAKKKRSPQASPTAAKKAAARQGSTTSPARTPRARATGPAPASAASPDQKYSALDAAAQVLRETGQALTCPELITQMATQGYWSSPKGKTPAATLYAALTREIQLKGDAARFEKTAPGKFAYRAPRTARP
jgi:hypothetical protein